MRTDEQVWADIVNECRIVNSGPRSGVIIRKDALLKRLHVALAIVDLAEDYIERDHDHHLHVDFETVRELIAKRKREDLRVAIARFRDGA